MIIGRSRLFAVRINNWVEIRSGRKLPVAETCETEVDARKIIKNRLDPWNRRTFYRFQFDNNGVINGITPAEREYEVTPVKMKLKSTIWSGGRVKGVIDCQKFSRKLRLPLKKDEMIELTKDQAELVLKDLE